VSRQGAEPESLWSIFGSEGDAPRFACRGRQDRSVPLANVPWNGGSLLLVQSLVVLHVLLVQLPGRIHRSPGLPVPMSRLPVLVLSFLLPVEVRRRELNIMLNDE